MSGARSFFVASTGMALVLAGIAWQPAAAQQVTTSSPFNNSSDSFFERNGVGFGFNIISNNAPLRQGGPSRTVGLTPSGQPTANGALQFRQNGAGGALPPFGNFNAAADNNTLGIGLHGRGGDAFLNFSASQGSSRGFTSQSPSITTSDGQPGFFSDTTQRPFVTSLVPNVGAMGVDPSGPGFTLPPPLSNGEISAGDSLLSERLRRLNSAEGKALYGNAGLGAAGAKARAVGGAPGGAAANANPAAGDAASGGTDRITKKLATARESSAGKPAPGVKEIRAKEAAVQDATQREALVDFQRGQEAEAAGKPTVAKVYYEMAARRATGDLKDLALAHAASVGTGAPAPGGSATTSANLNGSGAGAITTTPSGARPNSPRVVQPTRPAQPGQEAMAPTGVSSAIQDPSALNLFKAPRSTNNNSSNNSSSGSAANR